MFFDVVFYPGAGRKGVVAVYFDGRPCCRRVGPLFRKDADQLRERIASAGDDAALVGLYVEDFRLAIAQGVL